MGVTVTIRDQSSTGRQVGELVLEDIPAAITLYELIRTRVREEVARHNARPGSEFTGLVTPEGDPERRRIDWQAQADVATDAFTRNGFFVLVDGQQVTELDAELALDADSDVRFVRLVALVGG
jgi:hypothetical protein